MPVPTCGFTHKLSWRFDFCGHNANQIRIIWTRAHLDVLEHPPVRFGRIWSSSFGEKGLHGQPDTHTYIHTYIHTDRQTCEVMTIAQLSFSSNWAKKQTNKTSCEPVWGWWSRTWSQWLSYLAAPRLSNWCFPQGQRRSGACGYELLRAQRYSNSTWQALPPPQPVASETTI